MDDQPTKVLIVDDSALYRISIDNALREQPDIAIVGYAKSGLDALEKIAALDPDLLTLDVQMPDMDGIGVLREINKRRLRPKAIMVSSLTSEGAQVTTDALLEGAFDFILKPSGADAGANLRELREALDEKIGAFQQSRRQRRKTARSPSRVETDDGASPPNTVCRAVLVGTSTGGPAALKTVLPELPEDLPVPVLVVQHMPPKYTKSLAKRLDESCRLDVAEAEDGAVVRAGSILIAPGGRQMKLVKDNGKLRVSITDDPPEHGCRPAVDYLFRSATDAFKGQALGVILTGMGRDGLEGCRQLKTHGGSIFAQHEDGCTVYGMPKAVVEAGVADKVLPLERIGRAVSRHVSSSRRS